MGFPSLYFAIGATFLLTLASGLWLSKAGKPYNGAIFNVHKLVALSAAVMAGMQIYRIFISVNPPVGFIALVVLTGCIVLALFVTGAFLSLGNPAYTLLLLIHRISLLGAVITLVVMFYFLEGSLL